MTLWEHLVKEFSLHEIHSRIVVLIILFIYGLSLAVVMGRKRLIEEHRREMDVYVQQSRKLESLAVLARGIAHDFNNLLIVINGNTEYLRKTLQLSNSEQAAFQARLEKQGSFPFSSRKKSFHLFAYMHTLWFLFPRSNRFIPHDARRKGSQD